MLYENKKVPDVNLRKFQSISPKVRNAYVACVVSPQPPSRTAQSIVYMGYTKPNGRGASLSGPEPKNCEISQAFASRSAAKYLFSSLKAFNDKFLDSRLPYPHNNTDLAIDEARYIR